MHITPPCLWVYFYALAAIRIKGKFNNITFISAHTLTKDKNDGVKDVFHTKIEKIDGKCPALDTKIVLENINAMFGREGVFDATVHCSKDMSSIDFAVVRNMTVYITSFHLDNHNTTYLSHHRSTTNQIDHIVIDERHVFKYRLGLLTCHRQG